MKAQWAGLVALAVALGVAILVLLDADRTGAGLGRLRAPRSASSRSCGSSQRDLDLQHDRKTGDFAVLRRAFGRVSDDRAIQAIMIAFSFGALLEALAGFGTPIAICAVMLIALGFSPLKAAALALVANTAPWRSAPSGNPIVILAPITGLTRTTSPRWSGGRPRCSR